MVVDISQFPSPYVFQVLQGIALYPPGPYFVTLPALQKNFVNIFFVFAWEFCIEKWRGFLVNFFWLSVSHETKHEKSSKNSGKIRSKIRGKIRDENSNNSGNFRSAAFLT